MMGDITAMRDVGICIKTPTAVFEYAGEIYGHKVVVYTDTVGGGRLIIKELESPDEKPVAAIIKPHESLLSGLETPKPKSKLPDSKTLDLFK